GLRRVAAPGFPQPAAGSLSGMWARRRRGSGTWDCGCRLATAIRLDLSAVTDDRAWTTLDLGVRVVAFR
ncbi:MAG: hypothetical protein ACJ75M_07675, partial [Actinomycetes bacterium]